MKDLSLELPKTSAAERLATLGSGAFVGRTAELEHLKGALEAALAGRARPVFVAGEAGIGKTRLFEQFAEHAAMRGVRVLSGRCHEAASVPAYWPWLQVIRASIGPRRGAAESPENGDIISLIPEARKRVPTLAAIAPGEARFHLFDAVSAFFRRASRVRPLLIVIDDLHSADEPSVALLEFLARENGGARVLIVGAYRDVELPELHPIRQTLSSLQREHLTLAGLRRDEVGSLLGALAGPDLPRELVDAIHQKTGGNPFYVEEMTRQLVQDERLRPEAGGLRARPGWKALRLSETIRETLRRRLALLSPSSQQVLVAASVLGLEFTFQALQRVAGVSHERLLAILGEALVLRMVDEASPGLGRYRFVHALLQETLYAEPALAARHELHARAATELEALYGEAAESHAAELAHHFVRALPLGDAERAIFYCEKAGDLATCHFAYEQAAQHYEQALGALDLRSAGAGRRRCALLIRLGNAQWRCGETSRAQRTFPEAAGLARALRAPELLAEAALGLGGIGAATGPNPPLIDLLEEALDALPESDSPVRARLLARLAIELYHTPFADRRASLSEEAVKMAERLGDAGVRLATLCGRHLAVLGPDFAPEARGALADEMLAVARRVGEREVALRAHGLRMAALLEAGDVTGAEAELRACDSLATELRQPFARWQVGVFQAMGPGRRTPGRRCTPRTRSVRDRPRSHRGGGARSLRRPDRCRLLDAGRGRGPGRESAGVCRAVS